MVPLHSRHCPRFPQIPPYLLIPIQLMHILALSLRVRAADPYLAIVSIINPHTRQGVATGSSFQNNQIQLCTLRG